MNESLGFCVELFLKVGDVLVHLIFQKFLALLARPTVIGELTILLEALILLLIGKSVHLLLEDFLFDTVARF